MILPLLLAQTIPRDLTPLDAKARRVFAEGDDSLAGTGLASLRKHLLPQGDVEVRCWGGFAWGTTVVVLRLAHGNWSAARLIDGGGRKPTPLPAPKLGWPAFWTKAEELGIFSLPDQENAGSKKGFARIFDGYSTLVEVQREGTYRAYYDNNPEHQTNWPPARPMAALDAFVRSQFPTR